MLDTLRLRLTTKVTVSPASSARRASAAWRMSSIASGRVSANSAVTSPASSGAPSRARLIVSGRSAPRGPSVRPEPRRGMKLQKRVLITSSTPCASHSGSMNCGYTHSRSVSATPSADIRLRTWCGDGKGCSGEMWSPFALRPPRSVAPAATSRGHQSARLGGTWIPTPGSSRRASRTSRSIASTVTGEDHAGAGTSAPACSPVRQYASAAAVAISAGSSP